MSNKKRIGTLNDHKSRSRSGSNSSDDQNRRQSFFVGGSEHSGQQVLGPSDGNMTDRITQYFESARNHGAEVLTPEENARFGTSGAVKLTSGGHRLGDRVHFSDTMDSENLNVQTQQVSLMMWNNGFTVDDGPLRSYSDPQNHGFLQSVTQGNTPVELVRQYPGKSITLRMERKQEDFECKAKAFSGQGQRLGDLVPSIDGAGTVGQKITEATSSNATDPVGHSSASTVEQAQSEIKLDKHQPTTKVQIRLPDGNKIVGTFHHSHTLLDVRTFVVNAAPDFAFAPFVLLTTFPSKVIEPENMTLKDSGLLNSVIILKVI